MHLKKKRRLICIEIGNRLSNNYPHQTWDDEKYSEMKIALDELTAYQEDISEIKIIVVKAIQNETKKEKIK